MTTGSITRHLMVFDWIISTFVAFKLVGVLYTHSWRVASSHASAAVCCAKLCRYSLASYPGLPMFFNISREKSGRPGQSGDVMDTVWAAVSFSPPTRLRSVLHVRTYSREAPQYSKWHSSTVYKPERSRTTKKRTTEGARDRRGTWDSLAPRL